ncbi:MAG TPA: hypothetical protein VE398_08430, partial [Acidobacteriota bacterium]|nr:hypothetical protein [Acidobacteriota bacterium]
MDRSETALPEAGSGRKKFVLTMGGKGGVGKTSFLVALADWFDSNRIQVQLLDLDTENKARGSLAHFYGSRAPKLNIHTPAGLDGFVDYLMDRPPVILADMGKGSGQVTYDWFDRMYEDVQNAGILFTAVGIVTSDPASVESVLAWAANLQNRVTYLVVENSITEHAGFTYWRESHQAEEFRRFFHPAVVRMDYRLPELENATRNHGVTLGLVAERKTSAPELERSSLIMRAQSYRRRMFAEIDTVKEQLLP